MDKQNKKKKKTANRAKEDKNVRKMSFIRLEHGVGLKGKGATIKRYSKRFLKGYNDFVEGKNEAQMDAFVKRKIPWIKKIEFSGFVLGSILLLGLMLFFLNNTSIVVEEKTLSIAGLSPDFEGCRIVLISDMHGREFGNSQATLLRSVNGVRYDMMILAGDMVGKGGNAEPLYHFLDGLTSSSPVYFIAGDSDPGPLLETPREDIEGPLSDFVLEDWILGAQEHGAIYLDAPLCVVKNKSKLWLSPESMLDIEASQLLSTLNAQYRIETAEVIDGGSAARVSLPLTAWRVQCAEKLLEAVRSMSVDDLHIAVAHFPPYAPYNAESGFSDSTMLRTPDLVVAGHYCGGGWKVPGFGTLYIPAIEAARHGWFPDPSLVEGERRLSNVSVYTTGGLAVTDAIALPKMRLFNQPKVTVLTLTAALTDDLLGLNG